MASEIGFLGRRLLTSLSVHGPSTQTSQALPQSRWAQPRTFSTSVSRRISNPVELFSKFSIKKTVDSKSSLQSPPPPSKSALYKRADSPFKYDVDFDVSNFLSAMGDKFYGDHAEKAQREFEVRTRPVTGRTFQVGAGRDFSSAIKTLEINVSKNRVRRLWHQQKRHERPGKKRKRLKAERFARRFREGFKATVRRVQELTNQGW